jgi:hypothetical protein
MPVSQCSNAFAPQARLRRSTVLTHLVHTHKLRCWANLRVSDKDEEEVAAERMTSCVSTNGLQHTARWFAENDPELCHGGGSVRCSLTSSCGGRIEDLRHTRLRTPRKRKR